MNLRDDRRRTPVVQFALLLTCLVLCGLILVQQNVISQQSILLRLLSDDSSQLAAMKVQQAAQKR